MSIINWLSLAGSWLLVLGPLYQGALELLEEGIDRDDAALFEGLTPPPSPSRWWWLIPPVMLLKRRRRAAEFHALILSRMTPEQCASRAVFLHKATGWFIVAAGASCLATGETWRMAEHFEWPTELFAVVLLAMFAVVIKGVMASVARLRRIMA